MPAYHTVTGQKSLQTKNSGSYSFNDPFFGLKWSSKLEVLENKNL